MNFFPSGWNSDMTHQSRRDHSHQNVQLNDLRILAIMEPGLVAPFVEILKPIRIKELLPSSLLKCLLQLWTDRFPMNSAISFSFFWVKVAHQLHNRLRDAGFQCMSFELIIGRNAIPFPFSNKKNYFGMIVHRIRL